MVLLIEQERIAADEVNYYCDVGNAVSFPVVYGTISEPYQTVTLQISDSKLVGYNFTVRNDDTVSRTFQLRLKLGANVFFATGAAITLAAGASVNYSGILYLTTGNYIILFEGVCSGGTLVYLADFQIGQGNFNDVAGSLATPYVSALSLGANTRTTPIGKIAYMTLCVQVNAYTTGAVTNLENPGDNFTNGVSIKLNGTQLPWVDRFQDSDAGSLNGASGTLIIQVPSTGTNSVTIEKDNANTVVNVSMIGCPWILPLYSYSVFPVAPLDFSQGSTLYCNLEPLFLDSTKYFLVGKKRLVSFGVATDYYYYPSGTGILPCAYTFEIPDVASVSVNAYGWGGCINQLGVDAK